MWSYLFPRVPEPFLAWAVLFAVLLSILLLAVAFYASLQRLAMHSRPVRTRASLWAEAQRRHEADTRWECLGYVNGEPVEVLRRS